MAQRAGEYLKSICQLRPDSGFFDLLCLVITVDWPADGEVPILYCWDGTDAQPSHCDVCALPENAPPGAMHALPLQDALAALPGNTPGAAAPWRSAPFLKGVPPIGTVIPVVLHPHAATTLTREHLPADGTWVKLRNVGVMFFRGQVQAMYAPQSKWALAPPAKDLVSDAEERARRGLVATWAPQGAAAQAAYLTRVPAHAMRVPFSTLREARACV